MKFISAEEFLKQDEKVQETFINWWEPGIGDLFTYKEKDEHDCIEVECIQSKNRLRTISFAEVIPCICSLLTSILRIVKNQWILSN